MDDFSTGPGKLDAFSTGPGELDNFSTGPGEFIKVPIKESYLKCLPFSFLQSRNVIAGFLSFLGFESEVLQILQRLSHRTRAYIYNSCGLKNFLVSVDIMKSLYEAQENGVIEAYTKWQYVDLEKISQEIQEFKTIFERIDFMLEFYPSLADLILRGNWQV